MVGLSSSRWVETFPFLIRDPLIRPSMSGHDDSIKSFMWRVICPPVNLFPEKETKNALRLSGAPGIGGNWALSSVAIRGLIISWYTLARRQFVSFQKNVASPSLDDVLWKCVWVVYSAGSAVLSHTPLSNSSTVKFAKAPGRCAALHNIRTIKLSRYLANWSRDTAVSSTP